MSEQRAPAPPVASRAEYMRTTGFVLHTALSHRIMEAVDGMAVERIEPSDGLVNGAVTMLRQKSHAGINSANMALFMLSRKAPQVEALQMLDDDDFFEKYGIRQEDVDKSARVSQFRKGFGDRSFPWHFSAALANASVQTCVNDGRLSSKSAANLTLSDWAGVIGSPWFGHLVHNFAFTANGVLGPAASHIETYMNYELEKRVKSELAQRSQVLLIEGRLLNGGEWQDPKTGRTFLAATLNPAIRLALRKLMHAPGPYPSVGCPVARKVSRLPHGFIESNPHVAELIEKDILTITGDVSEDYVQVEQQTTAIDRMLQLFAGQLRRYDDMYGTPVASTGDVPMQHVRSEPTNALIVGPDTGLSLNA